VGKLKSGEGVSVVGDDGLGSYTIRRESRGG
jgi:hypothetical protein